MTCIFWANLGIKQGVQRYDEYFLSREKALKETCMPKKILQRSEVRSREGFFEKSERIREI